MTDDTLIHVRWLIRRDMPVVLDIEKRSFPQPWNEEELLACLSQRNCIGMVAEVGSEVLGYMVYELQKKGLLLLNIAVHPDYRRQGVAQAMVAKLKSKLSHHRRTTIQVVTTESNLPAQLFFSRQGFVAKNILCGYYDDGANGIDFEYELGSEPVKPRLGKNRISSYYEGR